MTDEIGMKDEIGMEIAEEQRKSYVRQIEGFKDNLKQVQEAKDNYEKQWKVDDELYAIIMKGHKKIESQFEFENEPRYWELRSEQALFKYKMDKHLAESKLASYDTQMDAINKELESLTIALNVLDEVGE